MGRWPAGGDLRPVALDTRVAGRWRCRTAGHPSARDSPSGRLDHQRTASESGRGLTTCGLVDFPRRRVLSGRGRDHACGHRCRQRLPGECVPGALGCPARLSVAHCTGSWPWATPLRSGLPSPAAVIDPRGHGQSGLLSVTQGDSGRTVRSGPIREHGTAPRRPLGQGRGERDDRRPRAQRPVEVSHTGSVRVPELLTLQAHPGLVHLVSFVEGTLEASVGWPGQSRPPSRQDRSPGARRN